MRKDTDYKIAIYDVDGKFVTSIIEEVSNLRDASCYALDAFQSLCNGCPSFMRIIDTQDPFAIGTLYKLVYSDSRLRYATSIRRTEFINH